MCRLVSGCVPLSLLVFAWACLDGLYCQQTLYYGSPGDGGQRKSGLWGGTVNPSENGGRSDNLNAVGLSCYHFDGKTHNDLNFRSVSFDPVSDKILLSVENQNSNLLTLLTTTVCSRITDCSQDNKNVTVLFHNADMKSRIGPFAMYDSRIYFIYQTKEYKFELRKHQSRIQLREFTECSQDYPIRGSTAFDVDKCTRVIANIHTEQYDNNLKTYSPTDGLTVLPRDDTVVLLTQTQHITYVTHPDRKATAESYSFFLKEIDLKGNIKELYESAVPTYYLRYVLHHTGAISYRGSALCWSSLDRVFCGWWRHGRLERIQEVLKQGQAANGCREANRDERNITTGIAIASASDGHDYRVYFGCQAQSQGIGGAGLVHFSSWGERKVWPLDSNSTKVLAGSMFITDRCLPRTHNRIPTPGPQYVHDAAPPTATVTSLHALVVLVTSALSWMLLPVSS